MADTNASASSDFPALNSDDVFPRPTSSQRHPSCPIPGTDIPVTPDAIVVYADYLLHQFTTIFNHDHEYFAVLQGYFNFMQDLSRDIKTPQDANRVSSALYDLDRVLHAGANDIHDFLSLDFFLLYFQTYAKKINASISKYYVELKFEGGLLKVCTKAPKRPLDNSDPTDSGIELANKYAVLENLEDSHITSENNGNPETPDDTSGANAMDQSPQSDAKINDNDPSETTPKSRKYHIFYESNTEYKTLVNSIKAIAPDADFSLSGRLYHVIFTSQDSYRAVQAFLEKSSVPARSVDPRSERPKKILIRGLPTETPALDVEEVLKENGLEPIKVAFLTNRRTKKPMPLFMASIRPSPLFDQVFQITHINHIKVTITPFKQIGYAICYRCQSHGHSSVSCKLTQKCLLCSKNHSAKDCPERGKPENFVCSNCKGNHAANWHGCTKHPANSKAKTNAKLNSQTGKATSPPANSPALNASAPPAANLPPQPSNRETTSRPPPKIKNYNNNTNSKPNWADRSEEITVESSNFNSYVHQPSKTPKPKIALNHPITKTNDSSNPNAEKIKQIEDPPEPAPLSSGQDSRNSDNSKSNRNNSDSSSPFADFADIFRTVKELMAVFNLNDILSLLKEIATVWKTQTDPISKIMLIFEKIDIYLNPPANHGS